MGEEGRIWSLGQLRAGHEAGGRLYEEVLRVKSLSAGVYTLAAGTTDPQTPHGEDEVYVVLAGTGSIEIGRRREQITTGSLVYVPAGVEHRFVDIVDELEVLVVFAPPESG